MHSQENIHRFLETVAHTEPDSLEQLVEGHISQALGFTTMNGERFVLRLADHENDFRADKYAGDVFGKRVLAPKVTAIGSFDDTSFYCISERIEGVPTSTLNLAEIKAIQPEMHSVFARLFTTDIVATTGYGEIDTITDNAPSTSWQAYLADHIAKTNVSTYKEAATYVGIDQALIDAFMEQFNRNLPYASEVRRLFHGDLGFDNLLVNDGQVTAVIDWAQMGYGDWMRDFARLEFWGPGRYGDAQAFAKQFNLEADHLDERTALYHAYNALLTIDFSCRHQNANTSEWLRQHVSEKLIP